MLVLRLRKVELLGFKSFFEKTLITFSGTGVTCIIGPNGCGKSNIVDAVSWVLGEQSHKMLRAERMSDCIFNGTAKRPPLGIAEVTLTLVDPEISEAVAKVMSIPQELPASVPGEGPDGDAVAQDALATAEASTDPAWNEPSTEDPPQEEGQGGRKFGRKRTATKSAMRLRPGEVTVGRRLYRSGQSEYLVNGRVARLRDVQEIFMGVGLGPDSYAIIEQGRIGQILNSKPMDRRAIIEEAAGITMYKSKRRLSEAKLEASKLNLSRVNDILAEVEKQLASLKRQASKSRRYAELREQMRGLLRRVLASKAEHLDREASRLESLLREMDAAEESQARAVHESETEQERLALRTHELDGELRRTHNLLGQAALDLDRAENRITFTREQTAQLASRLAQLAADIEQGVRQAADLSARSAAQREAATALREQTALLEAALRESSGELPARVAEQSGLEGRIEELRQLAGRLAQEMARAEAEAQQSEETASNRSAAEAARAVALETLEQENLVLEARAATEEANLEHSRQRALDLGAAERDAQEYLLRLRKAHQEAGQRLESARQDLSGERARQASVERILSERAYTVDAVQKLFSHSGSSAAREGSAVGSFRAVGLLADYAEVREEYEGAIEQFLREELEYVVVETFDHARAGVALLREEVGGRATFFVDSLRSLNLDAPLEEAEHSLPPGALARLDQLVEFRDPLGPAAKSFLAKLRGAYLAETPEIAERLARENPRGYFLTLDGTCYHGRTVSGGRKGEAGPLGLKRELRQHEAEVARLEGMVRDQQADWTRLEEEIAAAEVRHAGAAAEHLEAEKSLVAATHLHDQARAEHARASQLLGAERAEMARLRAEADAARARAEQSRREHAEALQSRAAAEAETVEATEQLAAVRRGFHALQESVAARREELAAMNERLAGAAAAEERLAHETAQADILLASLREQQASLLAEKTAMESSCEDLARQAADLSREKARLEGQKAELEREWDTARSRAAAIEESLRARRQELDALRAERSQRQIEMARNGADRDYLRQSCIAELNAQPEELIAQEEQLLAGEELVAAETSYSEMKARAEAMGPVNMMALEEYQECEQRESFLRREHNDLLQSIQNTQLTINELDQVSRQKFVEAFEFINAHFTLAFQTLFGGGHGEMRLSEPDSSGESGIDIVAQPPGKRLQNILLLSGGEKALTALALLIAVFRFQPSPFCILDEVDAPLDEANVGRFNKMLADMCGQTQFIVVTHNRRTMEMGSVLYGVTMQEPGVSQLVSVKWEEDAAVAPKAASSNAA